MEGQLQHPNPSFLEEVDPVADVTEQREDYMLKHDQNGSGNQRADVLVDNHGRNTGEEEKMHFGKSMHLVNVKRRKNLEGNADGDARERGDRNQPPHQG